MKIETVFKVGDRVYEGVRFQDWGTVEEIIEGYDFPVGVLFDSEIRGCFTSDGRYRLDDLQTLSFTEYDLEKGGFSQERPEILPERGDIVWVRNDKDGKWRIAHFVQKIQDIAYPFECSDYANLVDRDTYKFMTTKNPCKE